MPALSGVTLDSSGSPVSVLVRAYRESDGVFVGEYVSSAADGSWSIATEDTTKHFAVAHQSSGDYYWSNTGLYLPFSANLNDVSSTAKTVTAVDNAQFSSARSPFGGGSLLLDGTSDLVSITDHADLQAGTGACAFECMFYLAAYPASGGYSVIASKYSSFELRWILYLGNDASSDSGVRLAFGSTVVAGHSSQTATLSSLGITTGAWHYVGFSRASDGRVSAVFNNTVLPGSVSSYDISISGQPLQIGAQNSTLNLNGNIAHARWTKGASRAIRKPIGKYPTGTYSPSENSLIYSGLTPV